MEGAGDEVESRGIVMASWGVVDTARWAGDDFKNELGGEGCPEAGGGGGSVPTTVIELSMTCRVTF